LHAAPQSLRFGPRLFGLLPDLSGFFDDFSSELASILRPFQGAGKFSGRPAVHRPQLFPTPSRSSSRPAIRKGAGSLDRLGISLGVGGSGAAASPPAGSI